MVSTAAVACGIAEYTEFLGSAIQDLGHEVRVFSEIDRENLPYRLPYTPCWNRVVSETYKNLDKELSDWKPDMVHWQYEWSLHGPYGHPWDGPVFELARPRKHYATWHNIIGDGKSHFYARMFDRNITHNQPCRDALAQMGFPSTVIPHGTRKNKVTDTAVAKEKLGIPVDKKVITSFGFAVPRKGNHLILNVWERILKYCPDAFYLILGGKHPKGQISWVYYDLLERAQKLFPNDMKLTGFMGDQDLIDLYLSASDMVVFPHLGDERLLSASGSIRRVIDHGKLCVTQDIPFYAEFTPEMVLKIPRDMDFLLFGKWLGRALSNTESEENVSRRQKLKSYAEETYWDIVAKRHVEFYGESN